MMTVKEQQKWIEDVKKDFIRWLDGEIKKAKERGFNDLPTIRMPFGVDVKEIMDLYKIDNIYFREWYEPNSYIVHW